MKNIELLKELLKELQISPELKEEETPKLVCSIEGELIPFKDMDELKSYIWKNRVSDVVVYELKGKASVPFELEVK